MTGRQSGRWARRPTAPPGGRRMSLGQPLSPGPKTSPAPNTAPGRRCQSDRGSATAELAVSLPALLLMVLTAITAVLAVRTQMECVDAAREAARAAARGESGTLAGGRVAPAGAQVRVVTDGDTVRATVRAMVRPLGPRLPGFEVDAIAVAAAEPGVV